MKVLEVKNLSKSLNRKEVKGFLGIIQRNKFKHNVKIIDDISFDLNKGEILGIIGNNGSGKTTLLRLISGIYKEDNGEITTKSKIIPLINLWICIKNELTMKENIMLVGNLYGITNREIKKKYNNILDLCGLKEYENVTLRKFSSGMKSKLVFSIAVHANPDILILDEAFEVGDEKFRKKSEDYIKSKVKGGMSCLLVSHAQDIIRCLCDRLVYLDKGKIVDSGETDKVLNKYINS